METGVVVGGDDDVGCRTRPVQTRNKKDPVYGSSDESQDVIPRRRPRRPVVDSKGR